MILRLCMKTEILQLLGLIDAKKLNSFFYSISHCTFLLGDDLLMHISCFPLINECLMHSIFGSFYWSFKSCCFCFINKHHFFHADRSARSVTLCNSVKTLLKWKLWQRLSNAISCNVSLCANHCSTLKWPPHLSLFTAFQWTKQFITVSCTSLQCSAIECPALCVIIIVPKLSLRSEKALFTYLIVSSNV